MPVRILVTGDSADVKKEFDEISRKGKKEFREVGDAAARQGQRITGIFKKVGAAISIGFIAREVGRFTLDAIQKASMVTEATNLVKITFGESAEAVLDFSEKAAEAVGASRGEFLALSGELGSLVKSLKFTEKQSSQLSIAALQLAADIGSFKNAKTEEVFIAIRAAMIGSSEPMLRFGSDTREAALQQFALKEGIIDTNRKLTSQEKALAGLRKIADDNKDALGDVNRTQRDLATSTKIATGLLNTEIEKLGTELIPAATRFVLGIRIILKKGFSGIAEAIKDELDPSKWFTFDTPGWVKTLGEWDAKASDALVRFFSGGKTDLEGAYKVAGGIVGKAFQRAADHVMKPGLISKGGDSGISKYVKEVMDEIEKGISAAKGADVNELLLGVGSAEEKAKMMLRPLMEMKTQFGLIREDAGEIAIAKLDIAEADANALENLEKQRNLISQQISLSRRLGSEVFSIARGYTSIKESAIRIVDTIMENLIVFGITQLITGGKGGGFNPLKILGAQQGFSGRVPGPDTGRDDNLVLFKTRGQEDIQITPQGQSPIGGSGGFNVTIVAPNARSIDEEFFETTIVPLQNRFVGRGGTLMSSGLRNG